MTATRGRCIPVWLLCVLVCISFTGALSADMAGGSSALPINASVRQVQPAVSGLFQIHAARAWTDGVNGVPDFLDSWGAYRSRIASVVMHGAGASSPGKVGNAYAFIAPDELGNDVFYAGVERGSIEGPTLLVFELGYKGLSADGDLRISIEIDSAGGVASALFERFSAGGKYAPVVSLSGEGCDGNGAACVVANGALVEVGYNVSDFEKADKNLLHVRISTPEDQVGGQLSPMFSSGTADCVKEISGINNPTCTAGDVRLGSVVEGSLIISEGCNGPDTCFGGSNPGAACTTNAQCTGGGTCGDTVTFSARGQFTAGPQRYDVGVFFAVDGDANGDGARTGDCERFVFPTSPAPPNVNLDGDSCGDINAGQTLTNTIGPVKIRCVDSNNDGLVDIKHCETWAQSAGEIICGGPQSVKAGTPSKCDCSLLQGPGSCIAIPDNNPCTVDVCQGACSNSAATTCVNDTQCLIGGVQGQCTGITLKHIAGNAGTQCRAGTGVCDPAEVCDGVNTACPADSFAPATTECRAGSGTCDPAEFCTGTSASCPSNSFASSSTVCREAAGVCDVAETCTGSSATCPADQLATSAVTCRAASGVCDVAETCSGSSAACPSDSKSTAVCRASAGDCDLPESCNGTDNTCPNDAFKTNAVQCRAAAGVCDVAESCSGSSATCPEDAKSTAECRASAGFCDVPESCDGTNNACPNDAFKSNSVECRAVAGVCDVAESCTGSSATCPQDAFKGPEVVCRARVNSCDADEHCTGNSATCGQDLCLGGDTPISYP